MNVIAKFSIGSRLASGFGLLIVLLIASTVFSLSRMAGIEDRLENMQEVNNKETKLAVAMRIAVSQETSAMRDIVLLTDLADIAKMREVEKKAAQRYDVAAADLARMFQSDSSTTAQELELFSKIGKLQEVARKVDSKVIEFGAVNRNEEATKVLMDQAEPAVVPWVAALGELAAFEDKLNDKLVAEAKDAYATAKMITLTLAGVATFVGIIVGVVIARSIKIELGGEPRDAAKVAHAIAAGNLSLWIDLQPGDRNSLMAAMEEMRVNLVRIVGDVRQSSDSIATGSSQIATGNADLSQRTEEQASNLQQTAASMEELTATVKQNSDTARQANQLAMNASESAARGGFVVNQVVSTMEGIASSSKKIAQIIGVIDGIAFQTNILALNAAVEAARAGEGGRGFAVVAGEVRNLAQRSAAAAKEIKNLIGESVEKVEAGSKLAADAGQGMTTIVIQVKKVNDLLAEISAASQEQSTGIAQVGNAVHQLDQVTQQNAALVEESAAAADSLKHQAANLAQLVAVFKLGPEDGSQGRISTVVSSAVSVSTTRSATSQPTAVVRTQPAIRTVAGPVTLVQKPNTVSAAKSDDDWESF